YRFRGAVGCAVRQQHGAAMTTAILIDPERRSISLVELPQEQSLDAMRKLIGCEGMDYTVIDDMRDTIWVDGLALERGERTFAFKLSISPDPFAGRAIIVGADAWGREADPYISCEFLEDDIDWLGEIVPETTWVEEAYGLRAVVTYSRPK